MPAASSSCRWSTGWARVNLSARQINVALSDAVTKQGIKVAVQGVATVKIGSDDESIRNAAERFLGEESLLDSIVKNVLEGSLRSIVGTLTVEELNYDRQKFQQEVQGAAKADLATSGLSIDNFTIQAIRDEVGYMDLIGQQETARRERDARMAKATADQEAAVREAEAQQIKLNAQRDVSLRQAEVDVVDRGRRGEGVAGRAARPGRGPAGGRPPPDRAGRARGRLRKQKELITSTIRPAEAEAEAQIRRAEGDKGARIAAAQADAERVKLAGGAEAAVTVTKGEAQARVTLVNAEAIAKQTTLEGNAEAGITFTKGEAEAKALALRADAYRQFNEAAIISTVLSMLPEIVRAAAEPMAHIDSLTVLSSEGASDVVKTTTRTLAEASATREGPHRHRHPGAAQLGARQRRGRARRPRPPRRGAPGAASGRWRRLRRRRRRRRRPAGGSGPAPDRRPRGSAPAGGTARPRARPPSTPAARRPRRAGAPRRRAVTRPPSRRRPSRRPEQRFAKAAASMQAATTRATAPAAGALGGLTSQLPPHAAASRPAARATSGASPAPRRPRPASTSRRRSASPRSALAQELQPDPRASSGSAARGCGTSSGAGRARCGRCGAVARDELQARYGDVTIGMLLDAYEQAGTPGATAPRPEPAPGRGPGSTREERGLAAALFVCPTR